MKVWTLRADEAWICDQLVDDWTTHNHELVTHDINEADVIWLLSDWRWASVPYQYLQSKKVVTTIHHITSEKFDMRARYDFIRRDEITDTYHVYNVHTMDFIKPLTSKPIKMVPYWANQHLWKPVPVGDKRYLRSRYNLPADAYLVGSFQRDTEGHDLRSPKLEKGPDLFADAMVKLLVKHPNLHVVLAGWRRQYVIARLEEANIPYTYFERPPQYELNELYQTLDLYPVTARCEGGPQALIEGGLLGVPMVSRDIGIASQVLPTSAIADDVTTATPAVPNVSHMTLPGAFEGYHKMFEEVTNHG